MRSLFRYIKPITRDPALVMRDHCIRQVRGPTWTGQTIALPHA
jgi:hypothetical protein